MARSELHHVPLCRGKSTQPKSSDSFELADIDLNAPPFHVPYFLVYALQEDVNQCQIANAVRQGLQDTIFDMPIMAGTIAYHASQRPYISTTESSSVQLGVSHLEYDTDFPALEEFARRHYNPELLDRNKLLPPDSKPSSQFLGMRTEPGTPVLYTQMTFIRGGVILGFACHHWIFDAGTIDLFVHTIAQKSKARLFGQEPIKSDFTTERSYFNARPIDAAEAAIIEKKVKAMDVVAADAPPSDWLTSTTDPSRVIKSLAFCISRSKIDQLKARCQPSAPGKYVSTYDSIAALVWRAFIRARTEEKITHGPTKARLFSAMNVRGKGAPENYIGNCLAAPVADSFDTAALLQPQTPAEAALAIRTTLQETDLKIMSDTASLAQFVAPAKRLETNMHPNDLDVIASSWAFMRMDEYDFGFGLPAAGRAAVMLVNNALILWPQTSKDRKAQGQVLYVAVFEYIAQKLVKDEELMQYLEVL